MRGVRGMSKPTQYCTRCGIGPFFYVEGRPYPDLCLDHGAEAERVGLLVFVPGKGTCWYPPAGYVPLER